MFIHSMKIATICFLMRGDTIALALKKKSFGKGFLNGYGGKVQENETPEMAAVRELAEEGGVTVAPANLEKVAVIDFFDGENPLFKCHVFFVTAWHGDLVESDEMALPEWFSLKSIPYDRMWKADRQWLPLIFSGKKIYGKVYYKPSMNEMDHFEYVPL